MAQPIKAFKAQRGGALSPPWLSLCAEEIFQGAVPWQRLDLTDAQLLFLWWAVGWQISFQAMPAPTVALQMSISNSCLCGVQYGTMIPVGLSLWQASCHTQCKSVQGVALKSDALSVCLICP